MAKKFDLSGLRKQPLKKKTASTKKDDYIVEAIHQAEEKVIPPPPPVAKKVAKRPVPRPKVVYQEVIPEKEPVKRVTLDLPLELHTKLKIYAVTNQTTIRKFVIELLEEVLE